VVLLFLDYITPKNKKLFKNTNRKIEIAIQRLNSQQFVFFTKHDNVEAINKVLQYITHNENTRRLKIVSVVNETVQVTSKLKQDVEVLDRAYPTIHIEFVEEEGIFGPEKIMELSKRWKIPVNFMFIGSPGDRFPYRIQQLGDVRLII
jgi:hypothetical protein